MGETVTKWMPIVRLPALCGCPECGMTNVATDAERPVVVCSWCNVAFLARGVYAPVSDAGVER